MAIDFNFLSQFMKPKGEKLSVEESQQVQNYIDTNEDLTAEEKLFLCSQFNKVKES